MVPNKGIYIVKLAIFFLIFLLGCENLLMALEDSEKKVKYEVYSMETNNCADVLKFEVILDKKIYKKGNPIRATFLIVNKSTYDLILNGRMFLNSKDSPQAMRDVYLRIISPSGEEVPFSLFIEVGDPEKEHFRLVKKATTIKSESSIDLTRYYSFNEIGVYEITAFYENRFGKDLGISAWMGKLISDSVSIEVTP